jgi:hypothetical protein
LVGQLSIRFLSMQIGARDQLSPSLWLQTSAQSPKKRESFCPLLAFVCFNLRFALFFCLSVSMRQGSLIFFSRPERVELRLYFFSSPERATFEVMHPKTRP